MRDDRDGASAAPTPIALIHGLLFTPSSWFEANYAPLRKAGHPVVRLALPGHYPEASIPAGQAFDAAQVQAVFDRQLDAAGLTGPVVLVGHSTGGLAALCYATRRPERVAAVVSVGGTENGREESALYHGLQWLGERWRPLTQASLPPLLKLASATPAVHRFFLRDAMAHADRVLSQPAIRQAIAAYLPDLRRMDLAGLARILVDLVHLDISAPLRQLQCPVLILNGDRDIYVSLARVRYLAGLIPGAETRIYRDCGHFCMWEQSEAFYRDILDFLQRHGVH